MPLILVPFLLMLSLVLLPVMLPLVAVLDALDRRRRRRAAAVTPCAECGRILGRPALDAADAFCAENWRQWLEKHPGMTPRLVRRVWALCPHCGAAHDWDKSLGLRLVRNEFLDPPGQETAVQPSRQ